MDKEILPFWEIIPKFFLIPIKGVGLIALLLFTLIVTLLPSIFVFIIIFFAVIKFAMEILHNTAEGHLIAPKLNSKVLNQNYDLPFKLVLLLALPLVILWEIGEGHFFLSLLVVAFYSIVLPASIMTLAYTRHLLSAVNPIKLIALVSRLGSSYFILYLFLFLLNGAAPTAYVFFIGSIVDSSLFFAVLFQVYFFWVMFAMMGYVLYQYHEDIGYELPKEREQRKKDLSDPLSDFNRYIKKEDFSAAQRELKSLILRNPDDLQLREKFHKLVKISGDSEELVNQATGMISRLIVANKHFNAVNIYFDCIKADASFTLQNEDHYLPLVQEMRRMQMHSEAIKLSNGFHTLYPASQHTPYLYLLVIKILLEDLSHYDRAGEIIIFLTSHYPNHEITTELDRYRKLLMAL